MLTHFERSMQQMLACANKIANQFPQRLAVAYSGGLDSTVLLHWCAAFAEQHQYQLMAFHVHHGISLYADDWLIHCQQQCEQLAQRYPGLAFQAAHVDVSEAKQTGLEAAARRQRYLALGELCRQHQIDVLLTAHHQDDQSETILLQLLRGTGLAGLVGMQPVSAAEKLLGGARSLVARPLLDYSRAELQSYVSQYNLAHIEDESNIDVRYKRNALRQQIMPLLAQHFPGYQERFSRTAQHAQSAVNLLEQLAQQDYVSCLVGAELDAELDTVKLQRLSEVRMNNVLRYWLAQHHVQMPSAARLDEIRKQLLHASDDAQVRVRHGDIELHRYRQRINISRYVAPVQALQDFIWNGELSLRFPAFVGTLFFEPINFEPIKAGGLGIDRNWLMGKPLQLRPRQGGERLKLAANRPTRDMKSHYQAMGIPYWLRGRLPFVFIGEDLLFAAGVGVQSKFLTSSPTAVMLRWQPDSR